MNQRIASLLQRLLPLIFLAAGIVFIVLGSVTLGHHKTYLPATGTISSIDVEYGVGEDATDTYTVMVEYEVDGTTYFSELGEMKSGYHQGKEVDLLYNPENPEEIIPSGKTGPIIAVVFGGVVTLAGAFSIVRKIVTGR